MFALGTFNSQKAGADVSPKDSTNDGVTTTPAGPGPGAAIAMTLVFELDGAAVAFDEVTISLEGFGLPTNIAASSVSVRQASNGNAAAAVDVDGDNIVIELPDINGENEGLGIIGNTDVTIVLRRNAGITAPTAAGTYTVAVSHDDQAGAVELGMVTISRTVTVDPEEGARRDRNHRDRQSVRQWHRYALLQSLWCRRRRPFVRQERDGR